MIQMIIVNQCYRRKCGSGSADKPVDQVEEEFAGILDRIGVGKQMSRLFGGHKFAVVGAEADRSVLLPFHLKQRV